MKLFILCFLIPIISFSQELLLKITDKTSEEVHYISENKRVKIKTLSGNHEIGKIHFLPNDSIMVDDLKLSLNELKHIKKYPLGLTITGMTLVGIGGILIASSAIGAVITATSLGGADTGVIVGLLTSGIATSAAGLSIPFIFKKFKSDKHNFEIITAVK